MKPEERLLKYVKIDTKSNPESTSHPTSTNQFDLAKLLEQELKELNVSDVILDEHCYVYGKIPSNVKHKCKTIGLIAHMDTAPDFNGANVNPKVIYNWDGKDIQLNDDTILHVDKFKHMQSLIGHDLIVTDGTSLLGADDKAGISVIMSLAERLMNDQSIKHGDIMIAFTPDEEVGEGASLFDVEHFNADFAYTLDGDAVDDLSYETFNAASVDVYFKGESVHPGSAKGIMINASLLANEFINMLPVNKRPEYTSGYEGFNHLCEMHGSCESSHLEYIVRNHDIDKFNEQIALFEQIRDFINHKYKQELCSLNIKYQYKNMYEILKNHMEVVDYMQKAMLDENVTPKIACIRGGTDGATLTFKGLPCPNVGCGGGNFHGPYEYCSINELNKSLDVMLRLVQNIAEGE